jgi:Xaa-Pro dipeptidase
MSSSTGAAFAEGIVIEPSAPPLSFDPELHAENRQRLVAALRAAGATGSVLLVGGEARMRNETDHEPLFRQESYFAWAFGVREPDMVAIIDIVDGSSTLFIPRLGWEYAVWMGPLKSLEDWRAIYGVSSTSYLDDLTAALDARSGAPLHFLSGRNTDSGTVFAPVKVAEGRVNADGSLLQGIMSELRVFKTPREQATLRHAARVASEAHIACMQHARPGLRESQLESTFQHWCYYYGGCVRRRVCEHVGRGGHSVTSVKAAAAAGP